MEPGGDPWPLFFAAALGARDLGNPADEPVQHVTAVIARDVEAALEHEAREHQPQGHRSVDDESVTRASTVVSVAAS